MPQPAIHRLTDLTVSLPAADPLAMALADCIQEPEHLVAQNVFWEIRKIFVTTYQALIVLRGSVSASNRWINQNSSASGS